MAVKIISTDPSRGEVVIKIARRNLTVQEVEGQFAVVSPKNLKHGSSIASIACHAAAEALDEIKNKKKQPQLF